MNTEMDHQKKCSGFSMLGQAECSVMQVLMSIQKKGTIKSYYGFFLYDFTKHLPLAIIGNNYMIEKVVYIRQAIKQSSYMQR